MKYPESYVRSLDARSGAAVPLEVAEHASLFGVERRAALRRQAILADSSSTQEVSLALLWRELVHGLCRVSEGFFTDERCYLLLTSNAAGCSPLQGRRLEILDAVLCGAGQKNIAIDLGLAPSTIALNARLGLEFLGVTSKPSRVHPLLMLAAKADAKHDGTLTASVACISDGSQQLRVIAMPRPDRRLFRVLPPAELAVIRHLIEGLPYREIARLRQTSTRTIANQITAVFRRMRVSGRNELLSRLFFSEGLDRASVPRPSDVVETAPARNRALASAALRSA